MHNLTKFMIGVTTFLFCGSLPLSAQQVTTISSDMFKDLINKIKTDNGSETYSLNFGANNHTVATDNVAADPQGKYLCDNTKLDVSFSESEINSSLSISDGCVPRETQFSAGSGIQNDLKPLTIQSTNDASSNIFRKPSFNSLETDRKSYAGGTISGFNNRTEALEHIIEFTEGNELTLNAGDSLEFKGFSVIHLKSLTINGGAKLFNNSTTDQGSTILIVDDEVKIKGNADNCKFTPSSSFTNEDLEDNLSGCALVYGVYIISAKSISVDYALGNYSKNCNEDECKNIYISNEYNKAADKVGISIAPFYARLAASNISITNSLLGYYKSDWSFKYEPAEETTYSISVPSTAVTCENVTAEIFSSSDISRSVTVSLDGVGTFTDGTKTQDLSVSSSDPTKVEIKSTTLGTTKITVENATANVEFVTSALKLYRKDGSTLKDLNSAFYAGEPQNVYVGAVTTLDGDPTQCEYKKLEDQKVNLKLVSPNNLPITFEPYDSGSKCKKSEAGDSGTTGNTRDCNSSDLIANISSDGINVTLEQDGDYYKIPTFTSYDALPMLLQVKGTLALEEGDELGTKNELSTSWAYLVSPYKLGYDQENSNFYDYIAGQEISLKLQACASGSGCTPVNYFMANNVPISASYITTTISDPNNEGEGGEEATSDTTNYFATEKFDWQTSGIIDLKNKIKDVGSYKLNITDFNHVAEINQSGYVGISSLKIHGISDEEILPSDKKLFPYGFVVTTDKTNAVENACLKKDDQHYSYTYFGQPIPFNIAIVAKTAIYDEATEIYDDASHMADLGCNITIEPTALIEDDTHSIVSNISDDRLLKTLPALTFVGAIATCNENGNSCYLRINPKDLNATETTKYREELLDDLYYDTEKTKPRGLYANVGIKISSATCDLKNLIDDGTGKFTNIILKPTQSTALNNALSLTEPIKLNADSSATLKGILELRNGRIKLVDQRTYLDQELLLPIQMQYYHKKEGWIANTDDHCTMLSREHLILAKADAGKDQSDADDYYTASKFTNTNDSSPFFSNYKKMDRHAPSLVNCRSGSCSNTELISYGLTDSDGVANADGGLLYFKIPAAHEKNMIWLKLFPTSQNLTDALSKKVVFEGLGCATETAYEHCHTLENYSGGSYKKLEDYPLVYQPYWLNLTKESITTAIGIYDAKGNSDRVISRIDQE